MQALCYIGKNKLQAERVRDPEILNPQDVILNVVYSAVCGSDLHYLHGLIPTMKEGDIMGAMNSRAKLWKQVKLSGN